MFDGIRHMRRFTIPPLTQNRPPRYKTLKHNAILKRYNKNNRSRLIQQFRLGHNP